MKKIIIYLLASATVFNFFQGCKGRLFNNPFDPEKSERGFDVEATVSIEQGLSPADLAFSGDSIWIATGSSVLYSVNFNSGIWIRYLDLEYGNINGICYDGENLWINLEGKSEIAKISIISGEMIRNLRLKAGNYYSMDFKEGSVFIVDKNSNSVAKVDTASGEITDNIKVPVFTIDGFCNDGSSLWILERETLKIYRTDLLGNLVNNFKSPSESPSALSCTGENLWLGDTSGKIFRLSFK